ncbi:MAG: FHA domain-containing protein [Lachnospiraceae bacterium]|nr:FHA domain-containing protein [Lachnospiraceae bacterium]
MKLRKRIYVTWAIICLIISNVICGLNGYAKGNTEQQLTDVKSGIVKVQAGIEDDNGNFYVLKSCSGFVVSNTGEDGVYIVTNSSGITLTEQEKDAYAERENIRRKNDDSSETILRLIVESDVKTELEIVLSSEEENFAILKARDVLRERKALALENQNVCAIGDAVYALGFAEQEKDQITYKTENVQIRAGQLENDAAKIGRNTYLQHSAQIDEDITGGPLVVSDGYVVGLNDYNMTSDKNTAVYAIPVSRIISFLDNYGIYYINREINVSYAKLKDTYKRCKTEIASNDYKDKSKEELEEIMFEAEAYVNYEENYSAKQFDDITMQLIEAEKNLIKVTPKIRYFQIAVAIAIVGVLIWLVVIILSMLKINKMSDNSLDLKNKVQTNMMTENMPNNMNAQVNMNFQNQINTVGMNQIGNSQIGNSQVGNNPIVNNSGIVNRQVNFAYEDGNETVKMEPILRMNVGFGPTLIREKTGMSYPISKPQVVIGKKKENVDIVIDNNAAISRNHAQIINDNGRYVIFDLNSSNGTFVNGTSVGQGGMIINAGDKIGLADEIFQFQF